MEIVYASRARLPSISGNSIQVMKMCQAMARLGHSVTLLGFQGNGCPAVSLWDHYGVTTRFQIETLPSLRPWGNLRLVAGSCRRARRRSGALLYGRDLNSAVVGVSIGIPSILELHDVPQGARMRALLRHVVRSRALRRLVLISRGLESRLEAELSLRFSAGQVLVAPDGVDLHQFSSLPNKIEARRALGVLDPSRPVVGYSGSLHQGRGLGLVVQLAQRMPNVDFLLAGGDDDDVRTWKAHTSVAQIQNVDFRGFIPNGQLPAFLAACDALVMPYGTTVAVGGGGDTSTVMSPLKMFEYMASGRPILASDLPVLREVLSDRNALLLPPLDVGAWHRALTLVLEQPELARILGENALIDVRPYAWERRVERCLEATP